MRILAGTSGYNFDAWKGVFYPNTLPSSEWLGFYASKLPTVEINYTFYRIPNTKTLEGWFEQTPKDFSFTLKASQRITHRGRLEDADSTAYFYDKARSLGDKLGATLVQCPPALRKDVPRLESFLSSLPAHARPALEFRHASWFDEEVYAVLRAHGAALCIADDDELETPLVSTSSWGYVRLRKEAYDPALLKDWAQKLMSHEWTHALVYFKHEDGAVGVQLAEQLMALAT